jgi:hypothetical protein
MTRSSSVLRLSQRLLIAAAASAAAYTYVRTCRLCEEMITHCRRLARQNGMDQVCKSFLFGAVHADLLSRQHGTSAVGLSGLVICSYPQ